MVTRGTSARTAPNGVEPHSKAHSKEDKKEESSSTHRFISNSILLRPSEGFVCVLLILIGLGLSIAIYDISFRAEVTARENEFISMGRSVTASLKSRLQAEYATTDFIAFLASKESDSVGEILLEIESHMERLWKLPVHESRKWMNVVQVVPKAERRSFETSINNEIELLYPDWANRTEDKEIQIRFPDKTWAPYPDDSSTPDVFYPIIYRYPRFDKLLLWDPRNFELFPDWANIDIQDTNITCAAPAYSAVVLEFDFPAYVRCFGRVIGARGEVWSTSLALRVGAVLGDGLRSVVPDSLDEFGFHMFDITGLNEEQYALEGLYTHASVFRDAEVKVLSPFTSAIPGQDYFTVQDARTFDGQTDLHYESTVKYGGRLYLLIATGTTKTLELKSNLPTLHAMLAMLFFITLGSCIGVFLVVRNKAQLDQEKALVDTHTKLVGHMCHAMRNPLHSIMFIARVIHESTQELGQSMSESLCDNVDAMATKEAEAAHSRSTLPTGTAGLNNDISNTDPNNKNTDAEATTPASNRKGSNDSSTETKGSFSEDYEGRSRGASEEIVLSQANKDSVKELAEAVSVLDATAGSMYDLINSFMDFNQLNVCDLSLNVRLCDCIGVAATVFAQHRIIHRDHLEMTMVNEVGPCVMNLDLVRFRQVLSNGFGNSCKVTPTGYVNLHIRWASPKHEAVDFIIEDSGPGLLGVDPEKLFVEYERGAQAKSVKNETASTGLGLTISRKIAVAFGGSLYLEDRQPKDGVSGARFVFRLPADAIIVEPEQLAKNPKTKQQTGILPVPAQTVVPGAVVLDIPTAETIDLINKEQVGGANGASESASTSPSEIDIKQVKVAFAEDDPANHAILKRMLKRIGCEVVGAFHDGQPMRDFLCGSDSVLPDVALLDVVMGTLNGDAAMKEIRKFGCKVQCVALTGQSMPADLEHLMDCGFNAVLPKPYSTEDLETVIRERASQE